MSEAVPQVNRQVTLAQRPVGLPRESDFALVSGPVPEPGPGQVLLRTLYVSVDPYMRGRLRDAKSYTAPQAVGAVMEGGTVARVAGSRQPDFAAGEIVVARTGWQDYGLSDGSGLRRVDPRQAPISTALGVLGMPGLTAYCGPAARRAAARGRDGAGLRGRRRGGLGRGPDRQDPRLPRSRRGGHRRQGAPRSGGPRLRRRVQPSHHRRLRRRPRPPLPGRHRRALRQRRGTLSDATSGTSTCTRGWRSAGQISHYNDVQPATGPRVLWTLITKRARVEGFLVSDFQADHAAALAELAGWIAAGRLRYREDVVAGLEHAPRAFIGLLQGENIGKRVVKVAD